MPKIVEILKNHGPLASDVLAGKLVSQKATSSHSTARKQIQRAVKCGDILSTYPVRFDKSYLYYLESHTIQKYAKAVKKILPKKPAFHRVYKMLLNNKGYITSGQIAKSSGVVPNEAHYTTGKRIRLVNVIAQLLELGLIEKMGGYTDIYKIGKGFGTTQIKLGAFTKFLKLEQALLKDFVNWVQNIYIVGKKSYNVRCSETETVEFNTTCWDFMAPVYLGPCTKSTEVYSKGKMIQAFAVIDVIAFRPFTEDDTKALLERLKTVTLKWRKIRVFPLALAMSYKRGALDMLRKHGVAPLTYKEVWGRNIQELLKLYKAIVLGDDSQNLDSIEKALSISESSVEKDGIFGNIKGDLFEVMTSLAYRPEYSTTLQKKIKSGLTGEDFEIDVVAIDGEKTCLLLECKGRNLSEEENKIEIKRHFEDRCRVASETYGWDITNRYKKVEAIYITTSEESLIPPEYISESKCHGIICHVMSRKEVINFFNSVDRQLAELIKKYYIN